MCATLSPPITASCPAYGRPSRPTRSCRSTKTDYRWLSQVYVSVQPTTGTGALLWHALGAKTIELIHQNVHVEAVRDDLDEIVLDADLLEAVLETPDPDHKAKEIQIKVAERLRQHMGNPRYRKLSERLEILKEQHEAGSTAQHRLPESPA